MLVFYPEYWKTIFSDIICVKNTHTRNFEFWTKSMDKPLWKMSIFWPFLKLYHNFCKKHPYEKFRFLDKIHGLTPLENVHFWPLLKLEFFGLKMIVCYLKYPKTIFSDITSVKKSDKRRFDFWTKSMDLPLWKMSTFCPFLKLQFFST